MRSWKVEGSDAVGASLLGRAHRNGGGNSRHIVASQSAIIPIAVTLIQAT